MITGTGDAAVSVGDDARISLAAYQGTQTVHLSITGANGSWSLSLDRAGLDRLADALAVASRELEAVRDDATGRGELAKVRLVKNIDPQEPFLDLFEEPVGRGA